ncbi:hypothetical protein [Cellulomonas hominis]
MIVETDRQVVPAGAWWWTDGGVADPGRTVTASAERVLADLLRHATAVPDPAARGQELRSIERLLTDPAVGVLRRLREARAETIRERVAGGEGVAAMAAAEGVTVRRVQQLVAPRTTVAPGEARARHRAAMRARGQQAEARRVERVRESSRWLDRLDAGKTTRTALATRVGLTPRQLRDRLREAQVARDAGDGTGGASPR